MPTKQLKLLRILANAALICLLLGAVLTVMSNILSASYSAIVGVGTVIVTLYCYRRADRYVSASKDYYLWRYIPTALFIFGPLVVLALSAVNGDWAVTGWLLFLRFATNYLIPIGCLMIIERLLKQAITRQGESDTL